MYYDRFRQTSLKGYCQFFSWNAYYFGNALLEELNIGMDIESQGVGGMQKKKKGGGNKKIFNLENQTKYEEF